MRRRRLPAAFSFLVLLTCPALGAEESTGAAPAERVSYFRQVRPILQASCQGCHQPAKAGGDYVMTSHDALLRGGAGEEPAIVAGKPDESLLIELVTPVAGTAEMPVTGEPLTDSQIALIRRWIAEGAADDTPQNVRRRYDAEHPPEYTRPPVITSLDFSPDGALLAVAGFHEVLLHKPDGSEPVARLVGLSQRIESVRFSPNGSRLAVTGGLPCRMGEVQIWDVPRRRLKLSLPVTFDTVYGGVWSPDGGQIALGCADNTVRSIDAKTGEELVSMAAHQDWVRGVVFSADGKSLLSVSRDQTVKMTDVATQRFLGNLTTHTPGVLRGGMIAIDRHPTRAEVLVGGADGTPKLFRMDVKAAPAGGGNPNQIREYGALSGRAFDVCFSPDGTRVFAGASFNGSGGVRTYETDSGKLLWQREVPESGIYALAISPDGNVLAAAGADGRIRLIDAADGKIANTFVPVELQTPSDDGSGQLADAVEPGVEPKPTPARQPDVTGLEAEPESIRITNASDYAQMLITATIPDEGRIDEGRIDEGRIDATGLVTWRLEGDVAAVSAEGLIRPARNGTGTVTAEMGNRQVAIPIEVTGMDGRYVPDFVRDVKPVLSRLGCNAGTCHGAAKGKNGFKLSLRGYDALSDIRALTDDLASRRVNVASPDNSLMLLKATATVPHQGGQLIRPDDPYYRTIRAWIAGGASLNLSTPRVVKIDVSPGNPVLQRAGDRQQMRVVATYADGATRDVTRETFVESGNTEVATAGGGVMSAVRRGEAAALARYEGAYAATTLTVMGDRSGFTWQPPETWGRIDELVAAKWQRMKIQPSPPCDDAEFVRRVTLDLCGLPPTADEVRAFLADQRDARTKRDGLIDKLIGNEEYVEHWTNKWADLLQVNRKYLGPEGSVAFRKWIRDAVAENTRYDQWARSILAASGSNRENPAASYYKILRQPAETMENTTHLFLGVRFSCNKCHDHPFERWTQDQYYQTAAYFARFELKADPAGGDKKIGGTAVEGATPLYEIVADKPDGEIVHDRTKEVTAPQFPFECRHDPPEDATRRQQLAAWITSAENPYFARSYVNRLWGYLLGVGIIEPLDDIRASNPPSNPELLDYLTEQFVESGFDTRHVIRLICRSRTYQLSLETNRFNEDDRINYSHALARRLPAEVLYDAIYRATGSVSQIPGVPPGTRAAALPDAGVKLPDGFLGTLGRPARESACECERTGGLQLGPVMALINGPTVDRAVSDPKSALAALVASQPDDAKLIDEIFLRILNRPARPHEIELGRHELQALPEAHAQLAERLRQYEEQLAPTIAAQEKQRTEAITQAEDALAAYEEEIAAREEKLAREHQERFAAAETALKEHEARLPQLLAEWEKQAGRPTPWTPLEAVELTATNGAELKRQDDLSVFVTGPNGKTTYTLVAESNLTGVTGVRLEALGDERLPTKGPGRASSGNFVLTELRGEWASADAPQQKVPLVLQNAQADFSQDNYSVTTAIDGKKAPANNGWAIHPKIGENRTAVFETREDVATGPGRFTFYLDQEYQDGQHALGRFRISLCTAPRPVTLDKLPKEIVDVLAVAADERTDEQKAKLTAHYRGQDGQLKKLQSAVAEAKKPRPIDPKLIELRAKLAEASQPLPVDAKLARLRRDVGLSTKQLENARLTFTQDLAWALINSSAFLFNR